MFVARQTLGQTWAFLLTSCVILSYFELCISIYEKKREIHVYLLGLLEEKYVILTQLAHTPSVGFPYFLLNCNYI